MVAVGLVVRTLIVAALLIAAIGARDASAQPAATSLAGVVTRVSDGDTLWLRPGGAASRRKPVKVRMLGIDAPERCQAGGAAATAALRSRVLHQPVVVRVVGADDYGRLLGEVRLSGQDLSAWMVREGHAWSHRRRDVADVYALEEREARAAKRGVFGDPHAIEPRSFRRSHGNCA